MSKKWWVFPGNAKSLTLCQLTSWNLPDRRAARPPGSEREGPRKAVDICAEPLFCHLSFVVILVQNWVRTIIHFRLSWVYGLLAGEVFRTPITVCGCAGVGRVACCHGHGPLVHRAAPQTHLCTCACLPARRQATLSESAYTVGGEDS